MIKKTLKALLSPIVTILLLVIVLLFPSCSQKEDGAEAPKLETLEASREKAYNDLIGQYAMYKDRFEPYWKGASQMNQLVDGYFEDPSFPVLERYHKELKEFEQKLDRVDRRSIDLEDQFLKEAEQKEGIHEEELKRLLLLNNIMVFKQLSALSFDYRFKVDSLSFTVEDHGRDSLIFRPRIHMFQTPAVFFLDSAHRNISSHNLVMDKKSFNEADRVALGLMSRDGKYLRYVLKGEE